MVLVSATLAITGHSAYLRPTTDAFIILPIVLIGTNLLRALWGLRQALHLSWTRAVAALTLWFGLTWVVTLACIQAIVQRGGVFLRTPKSSTHAAWQRALQVTSLETTLGSICALAGIATFIHYPSVLTVGLMLICFSQAMIYLSAPSHSLASFRGSAAQRRMAAPQPREIQGTYTSESRLGLQLGAVVVGTPALCSGRLVMAHAGQAPLVVFAPAAAAPSGRAGQYPHPGRPFANCGGSHSSHTDAHPYPAAYVDPGANPHPHSSIAQPYAASYPAAYRNAHP